MGRKALESDSGKPWRQVDKWVLIEGAKMIPDGKGGYIVDDTTRDDSNSQARHNLIGVWVEDTTESPTHINKDSGEEDKASASPKEETLTLYECVECDGEVYPDMEYCITCGVPLAW